MLFGEKVGNTNEMENSSKRLNDTVPPVDPFSFTALHFLRNRLMPSGKIIKLLNFITKKDLKFRIYDREFNHRH